MREADGIIFGSPVLHRLTLPGQMKVFFDRPRRMQSTTRYLQAGSVVRLQPRLNPAGTILLRYLNHVLNYLGIVSAGWNQYAATAGKSDVVDLAERAAAVHWEQNLQEQYCMAIPIRYQEAILGDNRSYFRKIVEENRDFRPGDYERWVQMGWIK
ncbi:MAG: hypothetical protein M0C28_47305 [Candidatus Moduliflexus flocculans]|nr:hypothetical protein [Candidatus Moduliflexus flocculans]